MNKNSYSYARIRGNNISIIRVGGPNTVTNFYPKSVIRFSRSLMAKLFRSYDFRISNGA